MIASEGCQFPSFLETSSDAADWITGTSYRADQGFYSLQSDMFVDGGVYRRKIKVCVEDINSLNSTSVPKKRKLIDVALY